MRNSDYRDTPEYRASAGFPIAVILLSMFGIVAYLILGGKLISGTHEQARVYVPLQTAAISPMP